MIKIQIFGKPWFLENWNWSRQLQIVKITWPNRSKSLSKGFGYLKSIIIESDLVKVVLLYFSCKIYCELGGNVTERRGLLNKDCQSRLKSTPKVHPRLHLISHLFLYLRSGVFIFRIVSLTLLEVSICLLQSPSHSFMYREQLMTWIWTFMR